MMFVNLNQDVGWTTMASRGVLSWGMVGLLSIHVGWASPVRIDDHGRDHETELARMVGVWTVTSWEAEGNKLPAASIEDARMTIRKDGSFSVRLGGANLRGTIRFDPSSKPAKFDATTIDESGEESSFEGIYKIELKEGFIVWTVCVGAPGGGRPVEFVSEADAGTSLMIFRKPLE
jgi:uncharacterized protein (TIGR03067 family)